jgi:glycosyltransferase involved in cell wall biosynthesis
MNNKPLVSILLPNLNTRSFLKERMNSILNQTYTNWELIIADSYSDDGAWEYLKGFAEDDERITACQIPKGLYQAWNFCLKKAKGEYVYIATSDDGMALDCIEKMVNALEEHPECDICDSLLKVIDEEGNELSLLQYTYRNHIDFNPNKQHIRPVLHDCFLQLAGGTVYTSITQILIRRLLFEKTGGFSLECDSAADLDWGLKASIFANVVYLPNKLATWRIHKSQISKLNPNFSGYDVIIKSFHDINNILKKKNGKNVSRLIKFLYFSKFIAEIRTSSSLFNKFNLTIRYFFSHPKELICVSLLVLCKFYHTGSISQFILYRGKKFAKHIPTQYL